MFKLLGALIAIYTAYAAIRGEVYAKDGIRSRTVVKADSPGYFWGVIVIYAALSVTLFVVP